MNNTTETKTPTIESLSLLVDQLNELLNESNQIAETLLDKNNKLKAENKQLNHLLNQRNQQIMSLQQLISRKNIIQQLMGDDI